MKKLMPLLALALIVLFGCAKEEANELLLVDNTISSLDIDSDAKASNPNPRPFKGTIVYTGNDNSIECGCLESERGEFAGSGRLTHLGLTTSETDVCNTAGPCFGFTASEQCTEFTAANGDLLFAYLVDSYVVCGDFPDPFLYGETSIVFDGGTGRFEEASGQADVEIIVALDQFFQTESVSAKFDGEIYY
jgi:hypothetical protein